MTFKTMLARLIVPESNETKEIDVAQTWEVRWHSVHVTYKNGLCNLVPEMEVFTSEQEAEEFAQSLRNAMSITRLRGEGLGINVNKRPLIR